MKDKMCMIDILCRFLFKLIVVVFTCVCVFGKRTLQILPNRVYLLIFVTSEV